MSLRESLARESWGNFSSQPVEELMPDLVRGTLDQFERPGERANLVVMDALPPRWQVEWAQLMVLGRELPASFASAMLEVYAALGLDKLFGEMASQAAAVTVADLGAVLARARVGLGVESKRVELFQERLEALRRQIVVWLQLELLARWEAYEESRSELRVLEAAGGGPLDPVATSVVRRRVSALLAKVKVIEKQLKELTRGWGPAIPAQGLIFAREASRQVLEVIAVRESEMKRWASRPGGL